MKEKKLEIILEALADQLDAKETEVYVLKFRNEELKKENEDLKTRLQCLLNELKAREVDDGIF